MTRPPHVHLLDTVVERPTRNNPLTTERRPH